VEIVLLLVVVVGWLVVRGMDREESQRRLDQQDAEISRLRDLIAELKKPAVAPPAAVTEPKPQPERVPDEVTIRPISYRPPVVVQVEPMAAPPVPLPPVPPTPVMTPPVVLEPVILEPVILEPVITEPVKPVFNQPEPDLPHAAPPPPPSFTPAAAVPVEKRSLEQTLGVNWLNRLGIVLVVFGVAFGLAYEVTHLGPVGKVLLSFAISVILLGGGLWLERKPQYRIFARAGIGGGWALGFLTTYAMYFFPATQVLQSQAVDLALLFLVGVGMVVHSLRYRSQVVTGLAFLLAFSTVTISQVSAFSLLASAVLALGLEFVCVREEWYGLEIAGVLAAYGNHFLWLDRTLENFGGPGHPFPLWGESTALLILFWAIFRAGYCIRKPSDDTAEGMSGLVAVLNSIGLLTLMKYQSFHPEYAFRALLALGAVEMALAFVMRKRRRPAFAVLVVIASVLLIAAIPFRFHGIGWPLIWVLEGEALFVCGLLLKERLMRWLGMAAQLLVVGQMLAMHGGIVFAPQADGWVGIAVTFFVAAIALWLNAEWLGREDDEAEEHAPYRAALMLCSFAAALCAVFGLWVTVPGWTLVLLWAVLALLLVETGLRTRSIGLRLEGYGVLAVALMRLLAVNLSAAGTRGFGDIRLWAGLGVLTACVLLHLRLRGAGEAVHDGERVGVSGAAMWCASGLAMGLLYLEIPAPWLAVAWASLSLVLLEVGLRERAIGPRLQSYGAFAGSIMWLVLVNFQSAGTRGFTDPRLWAGVGVITAAVLLHLRLRSASEIVREEERIAISGAAMWCASSLAMGLLYIEVPERWLAIAWAALALVLLEVGLRERDLGPRLQSYGALAGALAWLVVVNFQSGTQAAWTDPRLWAGAGVIAACLLLYERLGRAEDGMLARERAIVGGAVMWCASALVSSLLYMELPEAWLAAGWACFALVLAGAALLRDGARLRGKSLILAGMVVARGLAINLGPVLVAAEAGSNWNRLAFFTAVALLAAAVPIGFLLRRKALPEGQRAHWLGVILHYPEQVFFFSTLTLLVAWVPADFHKANLTMGWSGLGVAVFMVALAAGERSFRLSGLGLLLLGVAKLLVVDVWGLPPTERYLLLIAVGVALLLVSFLYSRFGERLKEYL
jgi:hypothetical protein